MAFAVKAFREVSEGFWSSWMILMVPCMSLDWVMHEWTCMVSLTQFTWLERRLTWAREAT